MKIYSVNIFDIDKDDIENLCLSIDPVKKSRIEKFINKKDRIRALIGEILIRTMIIEEVDIKNENINFGKNHYGKPYLKEFEKFHFNISHSGNFVVCAVDDKPIGIDIEKIRYIDEYEEIAKKFFTLNELQYIFGKDFDSKLIKFYEIWTLKESYVKCCGQGLSIPLKNFSININKNDEVEAIIDNRHNQYTFRKFNIGADYKLAVCSLNKEISNNIVIKDQNELINNYSECCIK